MNQIRKRLEEIRETRRDELRKGITPYTTSSDFSFLCNALESTLAVLEPTLAVNEKVKEKLDKINIATKQLAGNIQFIRRHDIYVIQGFAQAALSDLAKIERGAD